jgi:LysR family hca operon transcriptional activator
LLRDVGSDHAFEKDFVYSGHAWKVSLMELRHLRYFVAVAEEGSFTQAAEHRLHTAQPSLSRQIRDLENDLGVQLIIRGPRGMELTPPGRIFFDHARLILAQVDAATEATRRAALPAKPSFTVGFLTGYEIEWLPKVMDILRDELHKADLTIQSASTPELVQALLQGKADVAFVRPDKQVGLEFARVASEPLFVLLPANHRLAARKAIRVEDLAREAFIGFSKKLAPALQRVIDDYVARAGVTLRQVQEAATLPTVISLALSTPGVTLMPAYALRLLPPSVVSRPLQGKAPTIDLAIAYNKTNASPLLKLLLSRADALVARAS